MTERALRAVIVASQVAGPGLPLAVFDGQVGDIIVKACNADLVIQALHQGNDLRQTLYRADDAAALLAGMWVAFGAGDGDLSGDKALEPSDQVGLIRASPVAIGGKDHVGLQKRAVGLDEGRQVADHFLLTLEEELHVDGQAARGLQHRLGGHDRDEHAALFIGCPAPPDFAIADFRGERWGLPKVEGFAGLHVEMAIVQHLGFPGPA